MHNDLNFMYNYSTVKRYDNTLHPKEDYINHADQFLLKPQPQFLRSNIRP